MTLRKNVRNHRLEEDAEMIEDFAAVVRDRIDRHLRLDTNPTRTESLEWIKALENVMRIASAIHGGDDYVQRRMDRERHNKAVAEAYLATQECLNKYRIDEHNAS